MKADLPDVDPKNVGIQLENGTLTVCSLYPFGGTPQNSFVSVDTGGSAITKMTGQSNKVLSDATGSLNAWTDNNPAPGGVAVITPGLPVQIPAALARNYSYKFGQRILFVDQNDNTDPNGLQIVQDQCPACSNPVYLTGGTVIHMDVYNPSKSCGRNSFSDYATGLVTINPR